jgi:hypothetical protein
MSERLAEFASVSPHEGLLVVVSAELGMVKFETRRDDVKLTQLEAERLARFILGERK